MFYLIVDILAAWYTQLYFNFATNCVYLPHLTLIHMRNMRAQTTAYIA